MSEPKTTCRKLGSESPRKDIPIDTKIPWAIFSIMLTLLMLFFGSSCHRIGEAPPDAEIRRNAQNLASIYASANAAGYDFAKQGETDLEQIVNLIVTGHTISIDDKGPFAGTFFGVPHLDQTEIEQACRYLEINTASGMILYHGNPAPIPMTEEQKREQRILMFTVAGFIWIFLLTLLFFFRQNQKKSQGS